MSQPPHVIPRTEVHRLRAANIDQEYRISVALPRGYGRDERRYPVLYVLDAAMAFGTVVEGHRLTSILDGLDEILIVGIGYPVDDFLDTLIPRTRDLTLSVDQDELEALARGSLGVAAPAFIGGAARFFDFIQQELMPFIWRRYPVNVADVGIAAASLGGLFGAYCLFEHPGTFGRFLLSSPSLGWDEGVLFRSERGYWSRSHELEAQVFLSVGGREAGVRLVRRLAATLRRRHYLGLRLVTSVFPDEAHGTVSGAALWRGPRVLYGQS